ncbi:MAG: DMT family transporter [Cyanobacteria bacterium P01_F01_bin.42]
MCLSAGAACIAFAPVFVRWSEVGPIATAFYRLALALPWLMAWNVGPQKPRLSLRRDWVLISSGLFFGADLAVWHWSIQLTTVANSVLLANFAPVFVVLGGWLIWRRTVSRSFLGAIAIVLVGICLLARASFAVSPQQVLGDALGLLTALFYGGYILAVSQLRRRYSTRIVALSSSLVGAIALGFVSLGTGEPLIPASGLGWLNLFGLAFLSQVLGQSLITQALADLPPAFSSVGLMLQPALATLLAWALFQEALSPIQGAGAVLVLMGITWARRLSVDAQDNTERVQERSCG